MSWFGRIATWVSVGVLHASAAQGPEFTASELARQVDYVNRFAAVRNVSYGEPRHRVVVVDRAASGRLLVNTLERWRRNDYPSGAIAARDLVIFRSGKLRGTGILVTDFADPMRGRSYAIWLPALRKVRRFTEPDPADSWANSNFSYGDIYLRRPEDEAHELLGRETFDRCLGALGLAQAQRDHYTASLPGGDCSPRGRTVFHVRSRPYDPGVGYDERHVWIDVETFADYRSVYYRDGQVLKTIDKSWRSMKLGDPRAQYWVYWYARSEDDGQEGMAFVAPEAVAWNTELDPSLWSEVTLRRIHR